MLQQNREKDTHDPKYTIKQVHVNGTITIELAPDVTERINIRRVVPFNEQNE